MDNQEKLQVLANAIGSPKVDLDKLEYKVMKKSVMLVNNGHLVGIIHRKVYDFLMMGAALEQQKNQKEK